MTSVPREPGITKLFTGHDWPSMIEDMAGHLTTFFERGGIKQAASDLFSRKDLDDHAPPPGFFMIHQTVMGNEEKYGFNNNGDSYPHEGLLRDHPTFVTHGKVYREHRNRSKEQAIGVIKAARYSHKLGRVELLKHVEIAKAEKEYEMAKAGKTLCASMSVRIPFDECSCLVEGSLVKVRNGWKPIESLKKGDMVLTHKRRFKPVVQLFHRQASDVRNVEVYGLPDPLHITTEHPLLVLDAGGATDNQRKFTRRKWKNRDQSLARGVAGYAKDAAFKRVGDVTPGDLVLYPVRQSGKGGADFPPWLLGLALADGSVFGQKRKRNRKGPWREQGVSFSLGLDKRDIIERLERICAAEGFNCKVYPEPDGKAAVKVHVYNRTLASYFLKHFGRGKHKHVGDIAHTWSSDVQTAFIAGWLDGDGSQDAKSGFVRGSSVLPSVAFGMWDLCLSCGVTCAMQKGECLGEWAASAHFYSLGMSPVAARPLLMQTTRMTTRAKDTRCNGVFLDLPSGRYYALKVLSVTEAPPAKVFNFEVADDHTYAVQGVMTHNCCGQQSKYSSLYCSHLRDHMRQWMPGFKKYAFARNPRGTYFDSSIVANPADRTARHIEYRFGPDLLKAASANVVLTGEQWAEFEGVNLDDRLEVDAPTGAMLRKLAALEDDGMYKAANWRVHGTSQSFLPEPKHITPEQWHVLTRLQPGTLFNKLAKRQVLLPFADFCAYTTGRSVDELQADPDFAKSASMLPSVFRAIADALDNGGCGCCQQDVDMFRASSNGFASMDSGSCDEVDQIMDDVADEHSVDAEKLPKRVIRITVIKKASESPRLFGPKLPAADLPPLVLLYGMYKAAACLDMQTLVPRIKSHVIEASAVDQQLVQNNAANGS